jgi:hypothetical protein
MDERLFKLPAAIGPRGKVARLGVPAKVLLLSGSVITRPKDYEEVERLRNFFGVVEYSSPPQLAESSPSINFVQLSATSRFLAGPDSRWRLPSPAEGRF